MKKMIIIVLFQLLSMFPIMAMEPAGKSLDSIIDGSKNTIDQHIRAKGDSLNLNMFGGYPRGVLRSKFEEITTAAKLKAQKAGIANIEQQEVYTKFQKRAQELLAQNSINYAEAQEIKGHLEDIKNLFPAAPVNSPASNPNTKSNAPAAATLNQSQKPAQDRANVNSAIRALRNRLILLTGGSAVTVAIAVVAWKKWQNRAQDDHQNETFNGKPADYGLIE